MQNTGVLINWVKFFMVTAILQLYEGQKVVHLCNRAHYNIASNMEIIRPMGNALFVCFGNSGFQQGNVSVIIGFGARCTHVTPVGKRLAGGRGL